MTDKAVVALARSAGVLVDWTDADGKAHRVGVETLRNVLSALGFPASTRQDIAHSRAAIAELRQTLPPLLVSRPGAAVKIGSQTSRVRLQLEDHESPSPLAQATFRAPAACGYHTLHIGERRHTLAVVPQRCFTPDDIRRGTRFAGIAVQIPSLRGGSTEGFGDFNALSQLAEDAADLGVDAILLSPVHAQFGARPQRFSPYAPSSRLFLNPLLSGLPGVGATAKCSGLIDWRKAGPAKQRALQLAFERFDQSNDDFRNFCRAGSTRLLRHALFEALDAHFCGRGRVGLSRWPEAFRNPEGQAVVRFARDNELAVRFALFQQWIAARSLSAVHARAHERMAIGLIADIAVGMDPSGSHAWSAPDELLGQLHIGAPPDSFNAAGQDWGLTSFSPQGLRRSGYAGFIDTLRAAMRYGGGVRLDHAMGIERLWILPKGASPGDGVYLTYPRKELQGLIALESLRHRAIVIGEDLGTVPAGFRRGLAQAGVLGMQVLWFERSGRGQFVQPEHWRRNAVAVTTTHDLPTVAGWWSERDIAWRKKLGQLPGPSLGREMSRRKADRKHLWSAFAEAEVAGTRAPAPDKPGAAVDAALEFVARTCCQLAIVPLEDLVGVIEQPNVPGTIHGHPNWRRRMKLQDPLRNRQVKTRVRDFLAARA